jgi:hypothetical protein
MSELYSKFDPLYTEQSIVWKEIGEMIGSDVNRFIWKKMLFDFGFLMAFGTLIREQDFRE